MQKRFLAAVLAVGSTAACSQSARPTRADARGAVSVVERFLKADLNGPPDSAWALLRGCDVRPTADYLAPTLEARIIATWAAKDTVRVAARYVLLGKLTSGSRGKVVWQFTSDVRADTVTFVVVPDSIGRLWIDCGDYPPIHTIVARMSRQVEQMDASTRTEWNAALAAAQRLR